ncbi:cupin domain-containing protein [uncultured Paludibaculum sp.]|uniref:cupin domain-containing protein n=1 Tax=uncultured Paludibaculum sp. TaxID=1765020 RepID=UPI002AAABF65|nr:cupin domain-containing protein [uncultured Paludibaculum sp.]
MPHLEVTEELRASAALYSLGAMPQEEAQAFAEHLKAGCAVCRSEVEAFEVTAAGLPLSLEDVAPPAGLRARVLEKIAEPEPGMHVVRESEGRWRPTPFPGVSSKTLYYDRETSMATNLLRLEPGASYPPHHHTAVEQCLVLEGDVRQGGVVMKSGDYSRNDAGSDHGLISTMNGCLLLLVSSMKDELLT